MRRRSCHLVLKRPRFAARLEYFTGEMTRTCQAQFVRTFLNWAICGTLCVLFLPASASLRKMLAFHVVAVGTYSPIGCSRAKLTVSKNRFSRTPLRVDQLQLGCCERFPKHPQHLSQSIMSKSKRNPGSSIRIDRPWRLENQSSIILYTYMIDAVATILEHTSQVHSTAKELGLL